MDIVNSAGANTISVIPNFVHDNGQSNTTGLNLDADEPWMSESDSFEQVTASIQQAVAKAMKVVVKPHLEHNDRNSPHR